MNETTFYFKYDGTTDAIKNHRIDAKQLSKALEHISDMIHDANIILNGVDSSEIKVYTHAKFIPGSFAVELLVSQDLQAAKDVLAFLGLIVSAGAGSLLAFIKASKGQKPKEQVTIDESTGEVEVTLADGSKQRASVEIAELANAPSIRNHISALMYSALDEDGITKFALSETEDFKTPVIQIEHSNREYFRTPRKLLVDEDSIETKATIEFIAANKNSRNFGWKINHLGEEVSAKIRDKVFMDSISRYDAPNIFGLKYEVELRVEMRKKVGVPEKKTYYIDRVLGKKRL